MGNWIQMEERVKQRSIRASFSKSLLLILGLTYILTLAVLLSFVRGYFYTNFYNTLKGQVQYSADYYEDNIATAGSLIENLYAEQDSWWRSDEARVQIYDTDSMLILDSQAHLVPNSELLDVKSALKGVAEYQIFKISETNEHVMSISTPLISTGKVIGVIRYIASLEQVDQNLKNITSLFFLIGGIITAVTALIGIIMSKKLIEPITELTETARRMAKGQYNVKSPVMSNDEIGTLSQTFNYMTSEISKKEELKNEFISSVSHELRTPLTAIKGWAVTLNDPATDPELMVAGLEIIEQESDRLKAMVNELLDFSRFSSGKIDMKFNWVNPANLKGYIESFAEGRKEREPRKFSFLMDDSVESFMGDENRIKQIFVNLIDNAFKFTEANDSIQVEISQDAQFTYFTVCDTGLGIALEEIPKVREKFYKGKHSKSSSGIGLSIVDEIARLHGGNLKIESVEGQGTVMEVSVHREVHYGKKIK